jgi:hypothetical protein
MSLALAVLQPLKQPLTERFFILVPIKRDTVSLTSPLMKI